MNNFAGNLTIFCFNDFKLKEAGEEPDWLIMLSVIQNFKYSLSIERSTKFTILMIDVLSIRMENASTLKTKYFHPMHTG